MDALEIAAKWHQEADQLIYDRGIDAILRSYGRVSYTGSYAINLMAWPDIDIDMVLGYRHGAGARSFFNR